MALPPPTIRLPTTTSNQLFGDQRDKNDSIFQFHGDVVKHGTATDATADHDGACAEIKYTRYVAIATFIGMVKGYIVTELG